MLSRKTINQTIYKLLHAAYAVRHNIFFYLSGIIVLYFNFWLFFKIIGKPLLTFNWIQSEMLHVITCIVLSLPFFFIQKRKIYYFHLIFGVNFYLLCSIIYYRTYYTIIPMSSFTMIDNLSGLKEAILSSFRWVDVLFLLPSVLLYVFYVWHGRLLIVDAGFRFRMKMFAALFLVSFSVIGYNLYSSRKDSLNFIGEKSLFNFDIVSATWNYGFLYCWTWQLNDWLNSDPSLSAEEKKVIAEWTRTHASSAPVHTHRHSGAKNVILVIVESLESFPIGKSVDSIAITPNLNALLQTEQCLYAPFVLPQIKDGRSSDSQLIINSGLLPIHSGATCFRFPNNQFLTLPNALRCKGYSTHTLVGGDPSYWNQATLSRNMGYDDLISIKNFKVDEFYNFGLTDSSFFAQSVEKIAQFREPYMAQMVTLSSHAPFNLPNGRITLKLKNDCAPELAKYLSAIHYTDQCLGMFIGKLRERGMLKNTTLIITGDHGAFEHKQYLHDAYGKQLLPVKSFVPLIVVNATHRQQYRKIMGQVDIYPTLQQLLRAEDYPWHGVGGSILDPQKKAIAVDATLKVWGDVQNCTPAELEAKQGAWQISDLIIRGNYFEHNEPCGGLKKK